MQVDIPVTDSGTISGVFAARDFSSILRAGSDGDSGGGGWLLTWLYFSQIVIFGKFSCSIVHSMNSH